MNDNPHRLMILKIANFNFFSFFNEIYAFLDKKFQFETICNLVN